MSVLFPSLVQMLMQWAPCNNLNSHNIILKSFVVIFQLEKKKDHISRALYGPKKCNTCLEYPKDGLTQTLPKFIEKKYI